MRWRSSAQRHCKSVTEGRASFAFGGGIEKVIVKYLTDK
jgi:hypothetical protein